MATSLEEANARIAALEQEVALLRSQQQKQLLGPLLFVGFPLPSHLNLSRRVRKLVVQLGATPFDRPKLGRECFNHLLQFCQPRVYIAVAAVVPLSTISL